MDHLTHLSGQRVWIAGSTKREVHLADVCDFLLPGRVKQWLQFLALLPIFRIGNYTYYLHFAFVEGEALAQAVAVVKELTQESLINNGDGRGMAVVLWGEFASLNERDLHRAEIIFPHHLPHRFVFRRSRGCFAGQQKVVEPIVIRQELDARERYGTYARQVVQPLKQLLVEPQQTLVFVAGLLGLQPEHQQVFRIEAELDVLEIVERADEQSRAGQQQRRDCDLRHEQRFAQTRYAGSRAAAALEGCI